MAAIQTPGEGEGVEGYQGEGETGETGKIDPKKWFRENRVWTAELEGIIDRDMIEIEEFMGMDDAELNEIANDDLKITNKLKRRRFVKAVRELEAKVSAENPLRTEVFIQGDPAYHRRMKEIARKGERVDIVLMSKKESEIIEKLKKQKEELDGMVAEWMKVGAKREREWITEKERMMNEFDAVMNALKMRRKEMTEKMDGIIGEDQERMENGLNTSKQMAEETGLAIKEIDSLAKTAQISDEEREKRVERIGNKVMGNHVDGQELEGIKEEGICVFRMIEKNELIEQIQSCGEIIYYMQPWNLSVERSVLKWRMPREENDSKSDDTIQYEIILDGSESLGTTIQNQMKLDHLKTNHAYSFQVKARRNSKHPWGPLSKSLKIKMDPLDSLICTDYELIPWLFKEIESKIERSSFTCELIYRASRDGWTPKDAHSRIDGNGPTFVLMKSEFDHVYGGFTTVKWTSQGGWITDPSAFIFLLKGKESILQKYNVTVPRAFQLGGEKKDSAVSHYSPYIVVFGAGCDLYAGPNCHLENKAATNFPKSYQMDPSNPSYAMDHCDLIGGHEGVNTHKKFKMKEIEYFLIT